MFPITVCPATCELCGNWLPQHQTSCPRNGVHPSQWTCSSSPSFDFDQTMSSIDIKQEEEEIVLLLSLTRQEQEELLL